MAFESDIATLMRSFNDLNTLTTGGIWYRNLPMDEDGNIDWSLNYIAWDSNKSGINTGMNNISLFTTYTLLVVVTSSDENDQFDTIIKSVYNNLHNYRGGKILSTTFENENKYTKLGDGFDGIYVSEQTFTILYGE
jgi:hypothetical protein